MAFDPRHFEDFLHVQAHQGCGCGDVLMANGLEDLLVFNLSISHRRVERFPFHDRLKIGGPRHEVADDRTDRREESIA